MERSRDMLSVDRVSGSKVKNQTNYNLDLIMMLDEKSEDDSVGVCVGANWDLNVY